MSRLKSGIIWPILGLKLAILDTFFKIWTSNLFCPAFTIILIGKPYYFRIYKYEYLGELMTSELHISQFGFFFKVSVTKRLITSATINIFP